MGYYIIDDDNKVPPSKGLVDEDVYEEMATKFVSESEDGVDNLLALLLKELLSGSDKDVGASEFDWGVEDDTAL